MEGIDANSQSAPIIETAISKTTRASSKWKGIELVQPLNHQKKPRSLEKLKRTKDETGTLTQILNRQKWAKNCNPK